MPVLGLDKLKELSIKLDNLQSNTQRTLVKQVENDSVELADLNRAYLEDGEKPDGIAISGRGYSPGYAGYKQMFAIHKNTAYVDLKFDGDFHKSFEFGHKASENFFVRSNPNRPYFKDLFERYGQLAGIRQKDMDYYVEKKLIPILEKDIMKQLT